MKYIDMHCDTVFGLLMKEDTGEEASLRKNDCHIDLLKMKHSGYLLQNFAICTFFGGEDNIMEVALRGIDKYYREIEANADLIRPAYSYQDIILNNSSGYMSSLLTLEEGAVVANDLGILRDYYRLGVRMIALTWNFSNGIAHPNFEYSSHADRNEMMHHLNTTEGLTEFGKQYVAEMNRLGMIVDVSHLGDRSFWDIVECCKGPFVASHSNSRAVCGVARNLSDEMILALARKGGVMGMNYCATFVSDDGHSTVKGIVDHIDHIKELGCIDNVGLGSDFDGIETPEGLQDCSMMELLVKEMENRGYTEEEIEKVCYKNVLRVYREVLK